MFYYSFLCSTLCGYTVSVLLFFFALYFMLLYCKCSIILFMFYFMWLCYVMFYYSFYVLLYVVILCKCCIILLHAQLYIIYLIGCQSHPKPLTSAPHSRYYLQLNSPASSLRWLHSAYSCIMKLSLHTLYWEICK